MSDNKATGYYQYSAKQGEEIYLVLTPLTEGVDAFMKYVSDLRAKIPTPRGATPNEMAANIAKQPSGAEKSFLVESIKLASGGDHPRWVIKGGSFKKFGVSCWPEVLEAAGIAKQLDPMKDNNPRGSWTAYYAERTNDEGKVVPDKVTKLVKA